MKSAIIAAIVAAFVASGSTYAAARINGHAIRPHSIPLNRLAGHLPRGRRGRPGTFNPSSLTTVAGGETTIPAQSSSNTFAWCDTGYVAVGGGGEGAATITASVPYKSGDGDSGWMLVASNTTDAPVTIRAVAVCAP